MRWVKRLARLRSGLVKVADTIHNSGGRRRDCPKCTAFLPVNEDVNVLFRLVYDADERLNQG